MSKISVILLGLFTWVGVAQTEESEVKQRIDDFFVAFHQQDTISMRNMFAKETFVGSLVNTASGSQLRTSSLKGLLAGIGGIPKENSFEEKILGYTVQIDGPMAMAWTPYEFWFNGEFSHCGVNAFQLFKTEGEWKIISILDTRRKDPCAP